MEYISAKYLVQIKIYLEDEIAWYWVIFIG